MNRFKTVMLMAVLTALFMWVGDLLGGRAGMMFAFVFAFIMNFGAYWFSDKIILRLHHAIPVQEGEAHELYDIVRELAIQAQMPLPKIYIIPDEAPNAFATGRNPEHAAVAVHQGLLRLLTREELKAVLGHELSHVKNRDTLVSTIAATLAGALSHLANMAMWRMMWGRHSDRDGGGGHPLIGLIALLIAPLAATLIQLAISRSREFLADESGAKLTGNPLALASALKKIEDWAKKIPPQVGSPSTAHLYIINPFSGGGLVKLFRTHPLTEERVKRLEALAMGQI